MENHTPMHFNLCDTYLNFALVLCVKLIQKPVKYKRAFLLILILCNNQLNNSREYSLTDSQIHFYTFIIFL